MEGSLRHHFTQDVDQVFTRVTDPDFLKRRAESAGEKNVTVTVDRDGDRMVIRIERDMERNLPSIMKKVFKPTSHMVDVQTWVLGGEVKSSEWTVEIEGQKRVDLRGKLTLRAAAGGGCDYVEEFSAKVGIPLIGGQVAKYVLNETTTAIRKQLEFTDKDLAAG